MVVLTIVATGVSIWAVRLVRDTLAINAKAVREARRANIIASESSLIEHRAWLNFTISTPHPWSFDGARISGRIQVSVENLGKEPALQCRLMCLAVSDRGYDDSHNHASIRALILQSTNYYARFKFIMPEQERTDFLHFDELVDNESNFLPRVFIMVAYKTKSSDVDKYTYMNFDSLADVGASNYVHAFSQLNGAGSFMVNLREAHSEMAT